MKRYAYVLVKRGCEIREVDIFRVVYDVAGLETPYTLALHALFDSV